MSQKILEKFINETLSEYCRRRNFELPESFQYDLVVTRDPSHGDFAANVAFKLARFARQNPNLIADELVLLMEGAKEGKSGLVSGVSRFVVAGGGFINFYMEKASLGQVLLDVHKQGRQYGRSDFGTGKKVLLEFVSANPTGPLTIAHGRQAAVGDSLARILKMTGHEVATEYYLNDAGRQMRLLGESLFARYCEELQIPAVLPEDGYRGAYLIEIAKRLVREKGDGLLKEDKEAQVEKCTRFAADAMMEEIRADLRRFRTEFNHYFSEQTLYKEDLVRQTLAFLRGKRFLYEQDGALWFRSTEFGDDKDRVVQKSSGEFTYLAPDIAYHHQKFQRGYNRLVNFMGPDHHGYIPRLKAACQALGHDANEVEARIVQLTTLYRQGEPVRMSTRAGEFVTLRELMDEVGEDAARFFFIMRRVESHLDFDLDLAKAKSQDNPVYYLQYAHARIASILRFSGHPVTTRVQLDLLDSEEENALIKIISEFPKALIQASEALEPYRLADYLRDLAALFHKFYQRHRVVSDQEDLTKARLLLSEAARIVLFNGLECLGISQPDSM